MARLVAGLALAWAVLAGAAHARAQLPADERLARVRSLIERANAALRSGDRVSALGLAREAIDVDPSAPDAYDVLGRLELSRGRPERAVEVYRTALANVANGGVLLLGLARSLHEAAPRARRGRYRDAMISEALRTVQAYVNTVPADPAGRLLLATMMREANHWPVALAAYRAVVATAAAGSPEAQEGARWVAALESLVRSADPISGPAYDPGCSAVAGLSPIRRALIGGRCADRVRSRAP